MAFALVISAFVINAFAVDEEHETVYQNAEFGYCYESYVTEDGRYVSSYSKSANTAISSGASTYGLRTANIESYDSEYIKSVLFDLGMDENNIEMMSDERLESYANAESITVTTTYTKSDADGNVTIVDEATAREAAGTYVVPLPPNIGDDDPGGYLPDPDYSYTSTDSYMKLTLALTTLSDGYYLYEVEAQWLTNPSFKAYDLLGATSLCAIVSNSTRLGWYRYVQNGSTYTVSFDSDDYRVASSGNWDGSAVVFDLSEVLSTADYTNCIIHYEFVARVTNINLETAFNVIGTYEHTNIALEVTPSLNVSTNGGISMDVEITANTVIETRTVVNPTPIIYEP